MPPIARSIVSRASTSTERRKRRPRGPELELLLHVEDVVSAADGVAPDPQRGLGVGVERDQPVREARAGARAVNQGSGSIQVVI